MTDTPPTDVDDIVVNGQRRRSPGDPFPSAGGWQNPGEVGGPQGELTGDADGDGGGDFDPCAAPATALEWNVDAAAAEALLKFKQKAQQLGDDGLYQREFGAQIYQAANGHIFLGPVTWGNPMTGTFDFDESLATQENLVGEIHTHPSPQMEPSVADWARLNIWSDWTGRNFRTYIVSRKPKYLYVRFCHSRL